jgi:protein gp37
MSKIEWTEQTWNPIIGCSIVSPGCTNCYAMKMAARTEAMGISRYNGTTRKVNGNIVWTGKLARAPEETLLVPLRRKTPTTYFVNSMSDLFHENVPDEWIDRIFAIMALTPQHTYQVLTKRAGRMRDYFKRCGLPDEHFNIAEDVRVAMTALASTPSRREMAPALKSIPLGKYCKEIPWPLPNVWLGVSTERQPEADERIPLLLQTPAAVRFISAEPLLGPIDLDAVPFTLSPGYFGSPLRWHHQPYADRNLPYPTLSWCIVGGESGPGYRPMQPEWAESLRDQCIEAGIPVFIKQMAGKKPIPPQLQIRQFPATI